MRIAFIVGRFPSLSQTFVLRQITGLLDRGHDVEVFAQSQGKDAIAHGDIEKYCLLKRTCYLNTHATSPNRIVRLARLVGLLMANFHRNPTAVLKTLNVMRFGRSALSLGVLGSVAPFLNKGPYDIVHCQFGTLGRLGLLLKDTGLLRGKLVTSFRGYDISSYAKVHGEQAYRNLLSRGDLFLCVSNYIKEKLVRLGCDPRKIIVHRSGAEVKKANLLLSSKTNNGKIRIVTIARLVEKKGVEYGIRAVAKILKRRHAIEYNIAGEGPLRDRLQSLIDELNAGDNIKLLGWKTQAEVADLLKASDILLAPSVTTKKGDEEGIPGVIMEAFAQGLPVTSTYHAGIPEVVQDGESGFLVQERDVDALAERLERLIEHPELRFAMGQNGRRFVEAHYDVDKLNDRLVRIYQQLMDGELPPASAQLRVSRGLSGVSEVR
jgi:colanic acid/amylovoran biosynthesis glycosyltransferase